MPPSQPNYVPLLERIGEALKAEKGPVEVDRLHRQPADPHGAVPVQLPALVGRAEAARAIIVRALGDPGRVSAEGRAEADPIAPNTTPEGRDENRRIEVVLRRQADTSCAPVDARFLGSRWFLSFIGVVLLPLLVWWFGPLLSVLEGWIARARGHRRDGADLGGRELWLDRRRKKNDAR